MFGLFRKKSQVEALIAADGMEHAVDRFAEIIVRKIPTAEVAYQFILEELDGARMGNAASQKYARNSGIAEVEYRGALNRSIPEVDGPDGPQQLLLALSLQINNQELMAEFRCRIGDKIMRKFKLGKYGDVEERVQRLSQTLRDVLIDDKDVMPALTPKIPAPVGAEARHIRNRERNIASARELLEQLKKMTGDSTEEIIERALGDAHGTKLPARTNSAVASVPKNYAIKPNGFTVEDAESGDGLAAIIRDGMFHGAVLISDTGAQGPLAPWPLDKNPFSDDNHFFGKGSSPQGPWSFSVRPSVPFSQILRETREEYARAGASS